MKSANSRDMSLGQRLPSLAALLTFATFVSSSHTFAKFERKRDRTSFAARVVSMLRFAATFAYTDDSVTVFVFFAAALLLVVVAIVIVFPFA
jgi:hypothetical protein